MKLAGLSVGHAGKRTSASSTVCSSMRWIACVAPMSSSPPPLSFSQPLFVPLLIDEMTGMARVKFSSKLRAVCRVATLAAGGHARQNPAPPGAHWSPSFCKVEGVRPGH